MKFIIEKFEKDYALIELENKKLVDIPKILIPIEATEGDVIEIRIDIEETNKRRNKIENLMSELFED